MTLQQIRNFDAVARLGNMGRAAEQLYLSQPCLSISVSNLEKELGIPLLARCGRTVRLTDEGEAFKLHAQQILQAVDEALIHMNSLSETAMHNIRLGYVTPLAVKYVPETLRSFLEVEGNENTQFVFESGATKELVRQLKNGVYDLLFCSHPGDDPELTMTPLIEQPLVLISPVDAPVEVSSLQELEALPLIGYPLNGAMDSRLANFQYQEKLHLNFVCRAPNEEAIAALTANHFGCAVIALVDGLEQMEMHRQLLPGSHTRTIYCVTLKKRKYYGTVKRFIDFCEQK